MSIATKNLFERIATYSFVLRCPFPVTECFLRLSAVCNSPEHPRPGRSRLVPDEENLLFGHVATHNFRLTTGKMIFFTILTPVIEGRFVSLDAADESDAVVRVRNPYWWTALWAVISFAFFVNAFRQPATVVAIPIYLQSAVSLLVPTIGVQFAEGRRIKRLFEKILLGGMAA